jgi:hypothetical protein
MWLIVVSPLVLCSIWVSLWLFGGSVNSERLWVEVIATLVAAAFAVGLWASRWASQLSGEGWPSRDSKETLTVFVTIIATFFLAHISPGAGLWAFIIFLSAVSLLRRWRRKAKKQA